MSDESDEPVDDVRAAIRVVVRGGSVERVLAEVKSWRDERKLVVGGWATDRGAVVVHVYRPSIRCAEIWRLDEQDWVRVFSSVREVGRRRK